MLPPQRNVVLALPDRRQLLDELQARGGRVLRDDPRDGYLAALVPYSLPGTSAGLPYTPRLALAA